MAGFVLACIFIQTFISKAFKMKNQIMDVNQRNAQKSFMVAFLFNNIPIYKIVLADFFLIPTKRKFIIF